MADSSMHAVADAQTMCGESASSLAGMLEALGRNAFIKHMRAHDMRMDQCSAAADALAAAVRDGVLTLDSALPSEFEDASRRMPPVVRALLVDNADPSQFSVSALLSALGRDSPAASEAVDVLEEAAVLSRKACAALRGAVDCERRIARDSVDQGPEHQLNLSLAALRLLIGEEEAAKLMRLPRVYRQRSAVAVPADGGSSADFASAPSAETLSAQVASLRASALASKRAGDGRKAVELLREARGVEQALQQAWRHTVDGAGADHAVGDGPQATDGGAHAADAADGASAELREMFVRRYSTSTRPWIPFHPDAYELTVNVALSADEAHGGGRLLGVFDGRIKPLSRREGDATVHSSRLLHAVTRMTHGTRYSLILFYDRRARAGRDNRWTAPPATPATE